MVQVKICRLHEEAILPKYAHAGDAGMDICSIVDESINPLERKIISTGISIEIPAGYEMQVRSKSGLAGNSGVFVLNSPGTIDAGYRGEIKVILFNTSREVYNVKKGEKIAQMILHKFETIELKETNELTKTSRGEGGFGSTGTR